VKTNHDDLRRELTRQPVTQVVFEACSQAGWVHDLCAELMLPALVASTTGTAWQWKRVKRKTDRDDADGRQSHGPATPSEAIGSSEFRGLRCRACRA